MTSNDTREGATRIGRVLGVALVAAAFSLALAPSAQAADAVHVSCGQTITVDTKLANDLVDCPNEGIIIGADGITLDLNGHTIDGDGTPVEGCPEPEPCDSGVVNSASSGGIPYNGPGHDGVTIKNGVIKEFVAVGIYDFTVADNRVRNVTVSDTGDGILMVRSRDGRIEDSTANDNEFFGIVVSSQSGPPRGRDIRIERNSVVGNGFGGIIVSRADRVRVAHNSVSGSADGDGILLFDASHCVVEQNSASGNGGGLGIADSHHNLVKGNSLHDNVFVGAYLLGSDDNRIEHNSFVGNSDGSEGGIHLLPDEQGQTSDRNAMSKNLLSHNVGDGILVDAHQVANLIEGNRANDNTDDGIDARSAATTLTANTAYHNHDLGIAAKAGVTDGGRNRAAGNGNPLQCTNIVCR